MLQGNVRSCSFQDGMAICTSKTERVYTGSMYKRLGPLGMSVGDSNFPVINFDCRVDLVDSNCSGNESFLQRKYDLNDA